MVFPLYLVALSIVVFGCHAVLHSRVGRAFPFIILRGRNAVSSTFEHLPTAFLASAKISVKELGTLSLTFGLLRLLSCLALLGISASAYITLDHSRQNWSVHDFAPRGWSQGKEPRSLNVLHRSKWIELSQIIYYVRRIHF